MMVYSIRLWIGVFLHESVSVACYLIGGLKGWADFISPLEDEE